MRTPPSSAYGWLMLAGIFVSIIFWSRLAKRDSRLVFIYLAALAGAFLGAKLVYLGAEGWLHWHDQDRWMQFATGKSIVDRSSKTNIGKLMLSYSGGGHENAGTCQVENAQAEKVLAELIAKINADG